MVVNIVGMLVWNGGPQCGMMVGHSGIVDSGQAGGQYSGHGV